MTNFEASRPIMTFYRPEIDGLRALSVILILATHLNLPLAEAGFIGVDIFFVISGYVIHRSLMQDVYNSKLSLKTFYLRRFHRIVPSLTVVVSATLLLCLFTLSPEKLKDASISGLAALAFVPNIHFNDTIGYFATEAKDIPLLHTWSLGVEEQFYILVPLLFWLSTLKRNAPSTTFILAVITIASLGWCLYETSSDPQRAFYLPMSRLWEIGVGGLVASSEHIWSKNQFCNRLAAPMGLALILAALTLIDEQAPFPGYWACLPVLGSALFICSNGQSLFCLLFRNPASVWLGQHSYTLYLVHWPIVVLCKQWGISIESLWLISIVLLMILLSFLLSKFVEKPLRFSGEQSTSTTQGIVIGVLICAVFASSVVVLDGLPQRLPERTLIAIDSHEHSEQSRIKCSPLFASKSSPCHFGDAKYHDVVIFGDSHAGSIAPELAASLINSGKSRGVTIYSTIRCAPLVAVVIVGPNTKTCNETTSGHFDEILHLEPRTVVLVARWANFESDIPSLGEGKRPAKLYRASGNSPVNLADALADTASKLQSRGIRVIIVGPVPEVGFDVPDAHIKSTWHQTPMPANLAATFAARQSRVLHALSTIKARLNVSIVYPHEVLCDQTQCKTVQDAFPLYIDNDHLSSKGSQLLAPKISSLIPAK